MIDLKSKKFRENILKSKWFLAFILLNAVLIWNLFNKKPISINTNALLIYIILNLILITFFIYRYLIIKPLTLLNNGIKLRKDFFEWTIINRIYIWQKRKPRNEIYNYNIGFYDYYLLIETFGNTYIYEITQIKSGIKKLNRYINNYRKNFAQQRIKTSLS